MAATSLKEQLSKIALKKVKLSNGMTLAEAMAHEARRLYDCIQHYIDAWYRVYKPHIYKRTYRYQGSLYAEDIADIRVVGNTLRIGVAFHYDLAMHPNLDTVENWDRYGVCHLLPINERHESFVPMLMEQGWYAPKLESMMGRAVPLLTRFDGIHAVSRGIRDFNRTNTLGIKIDASDFFSGRAY